MKTLGMALFLLLQVGWLGGDDPLTEAVAAYRNGQFRLAIQQFERLLPQYPAQAEHIKFNLAQSHFALRQPERAAAYYREVLSRLSPEFRSIALNNLALIAAQGNQLPEALDLLREALRAHPGNDRARTNYEILLRQLPPPPPPEPPPPPPPPPLAKPKPQEGTGGASSLRELPAEQARAELERLRQQERQFLQQQRMRAKARSRYSDRPDW